MKAARAAAVEARRAKRNYEKKLATNIDTDRKSFYVFIRSRSRTRRTIGPLVDDKGDLTVSQHDLAEKCNSYFASSLPFANTTLTEFPVTKLLDISVNEAVVRKNSKSYGQTKLAEQTLNTLVTWQTRLNRILWALK